MIVERISRIDCPAAKSKRWPGSSIRRAEFLPNLETIAYRVAIAALV